CRGQAESGGLGRKVGAQLRRNLKRAILVYGNTLRRLMRGNSRVTISHELLDLRRVGAQDCRDPTIDQVGRTRHLHIEARKKRDQIFRRCPVVGNHPLVDREQPHQTTVRVDADRDKVMDRPLAAIWTDEAMEMAVLAHLRRGVMAMVIPLRATLAIIDVARRIMRPGLDTRSIAQGLENHVLAALGKHLFAEQSFADGLLPVFVHVRPTGAAPRKEMLRRVQQWALRHKGIPVPALRSMGSMPHRVPLAPPSTVRRQRKGQPEPQSMARRQRRVQQEPQSMARWQHRVQPEPQNRASMRRKAQPEPQNRARQQRKGQQELQSMARQQRKGQPGPQNRVSKQHRGRQSTANMLSTDSRCRGSRYTGSRCKDWHYTGSFPPVL